MKKQFHPILAILIVFLVAYLPLNSFLFALKNDMFIGYLPPKYLMGEAIKNHELPLWNPYISFGLPFYGDMSSGYWNPITWIIASTTGYNPYTLTLEVMLYILLSGAGMYYLSGLYTKNRYIRLIAAVSFMCNGFIVGHLQHINWLSGAAFLPWSLWSLKKMYNQPTLKSICKAALLFYLLLSSSHPGIIIGAIYFFIAFGIFSLLQDYKAITRLELLKRIKLNTAFLFALTLLSAGMIAGYLDIMPHFERGEQIDISLSLTENTGFTSWVSTLLPFSTTTKSSYFTGDIAFRNIYWGILLFIFFALALITSKTREQVFFLAIGLLFLLVSLGQGFKLIAIKMLPLIGYVRVNAEFRIFTILSFVIVAVIALDQFQHAEPLVRKRLDHIMKGIGIVVIAITIWGLTYIFTTENSFFYSLNENFRHEPLRDYLKAAIKQFTIYDSFLIQGSIQLILLILIYSALKRRNFKSLFLITAFDIVLATLMNMPYTGVGRSSVANINRIHQKSVRGIPMPPLQPININDTIPRQERILFGEWSFYHKQIGSAKMILYPVKLKNNFLYFNKSKANSSLSISHLPYLFFSDSIQHERLFKIADVSPNNIKSFTTNELILNFDSATKQFLVFLQNYYPHWYYQQNNMTKPVLKAGITFMAIPISNEKGTIRIFFKPRLVKFLLIFSAIVLVLYTFITFCPFQKTIIDSKPGD